MFIAIFLTMLPDMRNSQLFVLFNSTDFQRWILHYNCA